MKHFPFVVMIAVLGAALGCAPKEEYEVLEPAVKPQPEFKGSVDPKMVGEWATKDAKAHLSLTNDGNAHIESTVQTRIGPQKIDTRPEWKVDGNTISFKDEKGVVSRYTVTVTGNELELKSLRSKTTYIKQK